MSDKNLSENVKSFAAKKVLAYLNDDPDKALPKIFCAFSWDIWD